MRVLVGHAIAHGSTRGVADRLAVGLRHAGLATDVRALNVVDDADAYGVFVLGSAVHNQSWLDPAKGFVRDNLELLGPRPVWLFSVGMPGALRGPWKRLGPTEAPVCGMAPSGLRRSRRASRWPFVAGLHSGCASGGGLPMARRDACAWPADPVGHAHAVRLRGATALRRAARG
ncbi:flavodoxin domain-containing protein [Streptomyces nigra]|uniref:flavodoxin domain-containing protein n=1 Tax=Streptomyces nigra TaxID=1827580 RepID=UPI003689806F